VIQVALDERFKDNAGSKILTAMEKLLIDASNNELILDNSQIEWLSMYDEIIIPRLQIQVKLFCDFIAGCAAKHMPGLKIVTKVGTLQTLMSEEQQVTTATFSEIDKLLKIFLTSPATSATAERSFSGLRR
jgi:hypothetical protein